MKLTIIIKIIFTFSQVRSQQNRANFLNSLRTLASWIHSSTSASLKVYFLCLDFLHSTDFDPCLISHSSFHFGSISSLDAIDQIAFSQNINPPYGISYDCQDYCWIYVFLGRFYQENLHWNYQSDISYCLRACVSDLKQMSRQMPKQKLKLQLQLFPFSLLQQLSFFSSLSKEFRLLGFVHYLLENTRPASLT